MRSIRLFTLFAATAFAGCGAPSTTGDVSGDSALKAVDPSDETQLSTWLAANEIERQPVIAEPATRGSSRNSKSIFLLFPRGETRTDALGSYALEVASATAPSGHVEFRRGREVLYRDPTPVEGSQRFITGRIPAQVRDAVKPGESLTWGVFFDGKADANAVAVVRLVKKTSADKQIARLEGDPRNNKQPALVKSMGRSQLLFNNGLYGEALSAYMQLADEHPDVGESWTRIVECMRRLELRESPLYGEAVGLMTGTKGGSRQQGLATLGGGGLRPGGPMPLQKDPNGTPSAPPATPSPMGEAPSTDGPGTVSPSGEPEAAPEGTPPTPEPTDTPEPGEEPTPPTPPTTPPQGEPRDGQARRNSENAQRSGEQAQRQAEQARLALQRANEALAAATAAGDPEAEAAAREAIATAEQELARAEAAAAAARQALDQAARAELDALLQSSGHQEPTQGPEAGDRTLEHLESWVTRKEAEARNALEAAQAATAAAAQAREANDPQAAELEAQAAALRASATAMNREAATARRDLNQVAQRSSYSIR